MQDVADLRHDSDHHGVGDAAARVPQQDVAETEVEPSRRGKLLWGAEPSGAADDQHAPAFVTLMVQPIDLEGNGSFESAWPNISQNPRIFDWNGVRVLALLSPKTVPNFYFEGAIVPRHQNRSNIVWCDGHASAMDVDRLNERATAGSSKGALRYFTLEDD